MEVSVGETEDMNVATEGFHSFRSVSPAGFAVDITFGSRPTLGGLHHPLNVIRRGKNLNIRR